MFHAGADTVLTATLDPDGCEDVTFTPGDGKAREIDTPGSTYWTTLATGFGVPESSFEYVPPQN